MEFYCTERGENNNKTLTKSDQIDPTHVDLQHNTHQGLTEKCARTSAFSSSSYPDTRTFVGRWSTQTCVKPRPLKRLQNKWLANYWLTQWSRILLEKPILPELVKKFPAFTRSHHWCLPWTRKIPTKPSHPISWTSIWTSSSHVCPVLPSGSFPSAFPSGKFSGLASIVPLYKWNGGNDMFLSV